MPSSKKNGYIWGFKRQDLAKWPDEALGVVVGRLCRPVCLVELWTNTGEHKLCMKSVCKAMHISKEDFLYTLKTLPGYKYNEDKVHHVLAREVLWRKHVEY